MSKLPKAFKRKDHDGMKDFSAIPAGDYVVKVTKSKYKANSKKTGHMLAIVFTVQNKAHKGAKIFANLNLDNPNEQAVEIANSELATIADAIGKTVIKDTDELMGKMLIVKVNRVDERNDVKMYSPLKKDVEIDEEEDGNSSDNGNSDDEVSADEVQALAKKYKGLTSAKKLKEILEEYDIDKVKEIPDVDENDLESLKEDLEEAIEEEEE